MFDLLSRAEMYPWMAEFKKDSSFHHDHHHDHAPGVVSGSYSSAKYELIMANLPAIGAIILPNVGGWASGLYFAGQVTKKAPGEKSWYDELKKPCWNPPKWAFGPAWTILYTGMGYASYLVWEDCGGFNESSVLPLTLYGTQLALNWAWTPIFFGLGNFKLALIEIAVLDVAVVATAISFWHVNRSAALLLLPYAGWLGLATALTHWIYKNNAPTARVTEVKEDDKGK